MNQNRMNNNKIFAQEDNNKEDLFMSNMEKNKAKNFNEKSTNLSDNEDGNNCSSKSNLGKSLFCLLNDKINEIKLKYLIIMQNPINFHLMILSMRASI